MHDKTACLLVVCYTSVMCNFNITSITNYRPMHYVYKNILPLKQCLWRCATKLPGSGFFDSWCSHLHTCWHLRPARPVLIRVTFHDDTVTSEWRRAALPVAT